MVCGQQTGRRPFKNAAKFTARLGTEIEKTMTVRAIQPVPIDKANTLLTFTTLEKRWRPVFIVCMQSRIDGRNGGRSALTDDWKSRKTRSNSKDPVFHMHIALTILTEVSLNKR